MRIAIDASSFLMRSAGVKTYVYHWVSHLHRLADGIDLFPRIPLPLPPLEHDRSLLPRWPTLTRLALLEAVRRGVPGVGRLALAPPDVYHATSQMQRPPRGAAVTTTVFDLTCWTMPEHHTPANVAVEKAWAERVARRARGLLAISEATRRDAVRILGIDADRIAVVPPGAGAAYFDATDEQKADAAARFGLARPWFLFVSTIEPRKNVDRLLDAWSSLPPAVREEFDLVLAGPAGWRATATMARLVASPPGVRYLGYVAEEHLPGLLAGATALVYPSLYEGFGLPVAQAMAAGVPVVTSDVSSLPEVAGDAAILVDPLSTSDIRAAIERLAGDPALRARLGARGRQRARANFTWPLSARRSLDFFEKAAG